MIDSTGILNQVFFIEESLWYCPNTSKKVAEQLLMTLAEIAEPS